MSNEIKLTDCGCNECGCDAGQEAQTFDQIAESTGVPVSDVIRGRIEKAGAAFFCNDNISAFLEPGDREKLVDEVAEKMEDVLKSLVIDIDHDHNTHDTARRVAKMFVNETMGGRFKPMPAVTSFPNASEYEGLYTIGPIKIRSMCAHHLMPIFGDCWIGVSPGSKVIGLSKFNRIADWVSARPSIQEELTSQIADEISRVAEAPGVAVLIKATHGCCTMRGVRVDNNTMTTSVMRGEFLTNTDLKKEFLNLTK